METTGFTTKGLTQAELDKNATALEEYNKRASGMGIQPITPSSTQPTTPIQVPPVPTGTSASSLGGYVDAYGEQQKSLQTKEQQQQAEADAEKSKAKKIFEDIIGVVKSRETLESEAKLAEKQQKVTEYTNQLDALSRAEQNEIKALDTQGLTDAQRAANQRDIQRKFAFQKADVALLQAASNRDYETAFNIVNQKITTALEPLKLELDYRQKAYDAIKRDLDKTQQRQWESQTKEAERRYEEKKTLEKYKGDLSIKAMENGRPIPSYVQSELNGAKNIQEVNDILARNNISLAKPSSGGGAGALASLPVSIQNRVISQAQKFGSTDITKKYNATIDSINVVNGIDKATKNPADHQAIVYSFAKALDPDSVVREGEYATVKKYAQSLINRYGKEIENALAGTGFLSEGAIENIQKTMNNLEKSRRPQFENQYNETARILDNIAGKPIASEILIDYTGGIAKQTTGQQVQSNGQTYTVGQVYNDGTSNWVVDANGKWTKQ